jgi:hypothetical protein
VCSNDESIGKRGLGFTAPVHRLSMPRSHFSFYRSALTMTNIPI